ncbi:AtzE family amidohydrolase [Roseomonas sp. 18066]|uniref:AtzE family amidohydrolase n=1 Tax=Roseomonas sp. 18066 TaxID=2681412 RepID=UPI0013576A7D|nr:AtzE family amidohydrolase [Roseomonas sp. 18066]
MTPWQDAASLAAAVRSGEITAVSVLTATLDRIARRDPALGAFTALVSARAMARAEALDAARAAGEALGPLAGVPFAVKNLFDVAGLPTLAGSAINRGRASATRDATLVARLEAQGAILVGALNMGEYAYDFTGENAHDGPSRNPHDLGRMSGGSSGGSGSAVAGGLVPIALGSDTNGSIRVPASLCGIFGLKPTYGRLSRAGSFPFVDSFDHLGPLARTVRDLALSYDAMQGPDPADPSCARRPVEPSLPGLEGGIGGLRIARACGYFRQGLSPEAALATDAVAHALGVTAEIEIPEAARARAAAYLITTAEGGALHLDRLRTRAEEFDPDTRDRLIAGCMTPAPLLIKAQKFRRWYQQQVLRLFDKVDAIIAPATPTTAPLLGQKLFSIGGETLPVRANLGMFTQPISFIGLPVVAVPVPEMGAARLPIGVQVIAAPWREDICLRIARHLEQHGVARAPRPVE